MTKNKIYEGEEGEFGNTVLIFDLGNDDKGFEIQMALHNGMALSVFIDDNQAKDIIKILENKLNGRF